MQQSRYTTQEQIEDMRKQILREKQKTAGMHVPGKKGRLRLAAKITEWVIFLCIAGMLITTLFNVYTAKSRGETPSIFGAFQLYAVESGSMEPTLSVSSVILCKVPKDPYNLRVSDIVTFHTTSGAVVTHRIVAVILDKSGNVLSYQTKGDNPANSPDPELLTPDRVAAVFVAKIPFT